MSSKLLKNGGYFVLGMTALVLVAVGVNLFFGPQERNKWDFGKRYDKTCPFLGGYPMVVHNQLRGKFKTVLEQAVREINTQVGEKLGMGSLFVLRGRSAPPSNSVANIYVGSAPKEWAVFGQPCEKIKLGEGGNTAAPELAHLRARWDKKTGKFISAQIYVCTDKLDKALLLMRGEAAKKIKRLGRLGVLKHELMHAVIGPNHVLWGGSLMTVSPDVRFFSDHTLKIIRNNIAKPCLKNKRVRLVP